MPISLTIPQARRVAALADELAGPVALHQLADGDDVYLAPDGEENRYRIAPDGESVEINA